MAANAEAWRAVVIEGALAPSAFLTPVTCSVLPASSRTGAELMEARGAYHEMVQRQMEATIHGAEEPLVP